MTILGKMKEIIAGTFSRRDCATWRGLPLSRQPLCEPGHASGENLNSGRPTHHPPQPYRSPDTKHLFLFDLYWSFGCCCCSCQVLIKEGALLPLVKSLEFPELNCQRYSALCIANLATTVCCSSGPLFLFLFFSSIYHQFVLFCFVLFCFVLFWLRFVWFSAALWSRLSVSPWTPRTRLRPDVTPCSLSPVSFVTAMSGVHPPCWWSVFVRFDLSATTGNHMTIVEDGGLAAFFSLCNSPDLIWCLSTTWAVLWPTSPALLRITI